MYLDLLLLDYLRTGQFTLEKVKDFIERGANPNIISNDAFKDTPLILATDVGNEEVVKYLLNKNISVNQGDLTGLTALHYACFKGFIDILFLLIEKGGNINQTDNYGSTLLHAASSEGQLKIIRFLVEEKKVDITQTDNNGESALSLAKKGKHSKVEQYLLNQKDIIEKKHTITQQISPFIWLNFQENVDNSTKKTFSK